MSQKDYRHLYSPTSTNNSKKSYFYNFKHSWNEFSFKFIKKAKLLNLRRGIFDTKVKLVSYRFKIGNLILSAILISMLPLAFSSFSDFFNGSPLSYAFGETTIESLKPIKSQLITSEANISTGTIIENYIINDEIERTIENKRREEEARRVAEELKQKEIERQARIAQGVSNLNAFLTRNNSPMAGFAESIITAAESCGVDYRSVLAISMKESGLGVAMLASQKGTAFGYMDGISGESWDTALPRLICKVGNQYTESYGLTISMAKAYGNPSWTDEEAATWLGHVVRYKQVIP